MIEAIGHAASIVGAMTWEILWALILGFFLASIVESAVSKQKVSRLLPTAGPRSLSVAAGLGIASSSCSYAAVALARALFRRGANFTAVIAFQVASTNLVIELGAILWLVIGWQFTLAEYAGGIVMIVVVAVLFRLVTSKDDTDRALRTAQEGRSGSMEGHAAMNMTGWKSIPDNFVMEWAATFRDIVLGLVIAGCVDAWVPQHFWRSLFFTGHPLLAKFWGPIVGPIVAMLTFVCSIGNVPMAGVLWSDGISFGGVISFLFADLIIVPIVLIYRKYYGAKMAVVLFFGLWIAATVSGYIIEAIFGPLSLVPESRHVIHQHAQVSWNYTTYLDIGALALSAGLLIWFWCKGSRPMLKMMNGSPDSGRGHSADVDGDVDDHTAPLATGHGHHHHHHH